MRRSRKSAPRSGGGSFRGGNQNLVVLLLVVLIIISSFHLYLDHLSGIAPPPSTHQETGITETKKSSDIPRKESKDTLHVVPGSLVPAPLSQPAPVPLLTGDMPAAGEIQVQILNGCGTPGIASKIRTVLRRRGFDVLSFGNAQKQDYAKTSVVARAEAPFGELAARRIAHSLGISADQISLQPNPGLGDIDVTLILGSDYQRLNLTGE